MATTLVRPVVTMNLANRSISRAGLLINRAIHPLVARRFGREVAMFAQTNDVTITPTVNGIITTTGLNQLKIERRLFASLFMKTGVSQIEVPKGMSADEIGRMFNMLVTRDVPNKELTTDSVSITINLINEGMRIKTGLLGLILGGHRKPKFVNMLLSMQRGLTNEEIVYVAQCLSSVRKDIAAIPEHEDFSREYTNELSSGLDPAYSGTPSWETYPAVEARYSGSCLSRLADRIRHRTPQEIQEIINHLSEMNGELAEGVKSCLTDIFKSIP